MDNIRNVIGCPVAGLTDDELFDASTVVRDFNDAFLRNKAFTNLPRKFNVAITGCRENCTHGETQDLSLTPAIKIIAGEEVKGFNIAVGGKIGSGGLAPGDAARCVLPARGRSGALQSHHAALSRLRPAARAQSGAVGVSRSTNGASIDFGRSCSGAWATGCCRRGETPDPASTTITSASPARSNRDSARSASTCRWVVLPPIRCRPGSRCAPLRQR